MRRVKKIAAIGLAMIIILQSLSLLYVQCGFRLNHAYIASVLCINRDKPAMHCDGKCFLKKEISRNADRQNNDEKTLPAFFSLNLFIEQPIHQIFFSEATKHPIAFLQPYFSSGFLITDERPPTG